MHHTIRLGALPFALILGACSGGMESAPNGGDTTLGETEEASTALDFGTWGRRPMPAQFCTKSDHTLSDEFYFTARDWVVDALQASWGQVPGITIVDRGTCVEGSLDLTVALHAANGFGDIHGRCGTSGTCDVWAVEGDLGPDAEYLFRETVVHEVGHGLGLGHEHQMPGAPLLCEYEQQKLAACTACYSQGRCSADEFNTCFHPDPPATTSKTLSSGQKKNAKAWIDDRAINPSYEVLTPYDPYSIMNYCADANGRDGWDWLPTELDLLGMEMLYPDNRVYPLGCGRGCFSTSEGAVLHTDGTLVPGWTARGGVNVKFTDGQPDMLVYFFPDGVWGTPHSTFRDPRGQSRNTEGRAMRSDGLYTALLLASSSSL